MSSDTAWGVVSFLGALLVVFVLVVASKLPNRIEDERSVARFAELAEVKVDQIQIIRRSNSSLITGDTHDVTYELIIGERRESGRCTSGVFSPMICRLYGSGEGE